AVSSAVSRSYPSASAARTPPATSGSSPGMLRLTCTIASIRCSGRSCVDEAREEPTERVVEGVRSVQVHPMAAVQPRHLDARQVLLDVSRLLDETLLALAEGQQGGHAVLADAVVEGGVRQRPHRCACDTEGRVVQHVL